MSPNVSFVSYKTCHYVQLQVGLQLVVKFCDSQRAVELTHNCLEITAFRSDGFDSYEYQVMGCDVVSWAQ